MKTTMTDANARAKAIDVTASWIIQAPAGSGKTELLVQRILAALATCEHGPEEILAITFTKKAAAEMRSRVFSALAMTQQPDHSLAPHQKKTKALAHAACRQNERKQWRLFENPNRLQIKTMDALCHQICKQSGLQPPMPHLSPMTLYRRVAKNFLQEAMVRQDTHAKTLLQHFHHHTQHVEQLCALALAERDQWLPYLHIGDADSLFAANQTYLRMLCLDTCQALIAALETWLTPSWREAIAFSMAQRDLPWLALDSIPIQEKALLQTYQSLKALAVLCLTQQGAPRKTVTIKQGFPPASAASCPEEKTAFKLHKADMLACLQGLLDDAHVLQCLQNMFQLPHPNYPVHYQGILSCMTTLLPQLVAHLNWTCLSERTADFTHTALNAIGILKHTRYCPSDVWLDRNVAIKHLLVDEFQDTSVTQLSLLEALVDSWNPHDDLNTLCIVGDPMQSIYRFRQADASLFGQVVDHGLGPVRPKCIQLTSNFRSQSGLINWFNAFFEQLFPKTHDSELGAFPYHACVAMQKGPGTVHTHWWLDDAMTAEADHIAKTCQALCKQGATSVAILVRSRRIAQPIVQALKSHHLPFKRDGLDALCDVDIVRDLLMMLEFLWHPYDDLTLANLLCSARIAMPHQTLYQLRTLAPQRTLWQALTTQSDHPTLHEIQKEYDAIIQLLQWCLAQSPVLSLHDILFKYWQSVCPHADAPEDADALLFFQCLQQCAHDLTDDFYPALMDLLTKTTASAGHTDTAGITVMTIHQAKGLEFDHVFVPGVATITPPRQQKILMLDQGKHPHALLMLPSKSTHGDHSSAHRYLHEKAHKQETQELIRLLYVAATRARKSLHWSGTLKEADRIPSRAPLALMWPHLQPQERQLSRSCHSPVPHVCEVYKNWPMPDNLCAMAHDMQSQHRPVSLPKLETFEQRWGQVVHALMACLMQTKSLCHDFLHAQTMAFCIDLRMPHDEYARIESNLRRIIPIVLHQPRVKWLLAQEVTLHCEQPIYTNDGRQFILDLCFSTETCFWIIDYKIYEQGDRSIQTIMAPYYDKMHRYKQACAQHAKKICMVLFNPITNDWHVVPDEMHPSK